MSFVLPETYSKPDLTPTTHKVYVRYLNKLAVLGFTTTESLQSQARKIISEIKKMHPGDDEKDRQHRRYFTSAIYYVLPYEYRQKSNPYYSLVKKSRPPVEGGWEENKRKYLATRD